MKTKVVTYQSPGGDRINLCPKCEKALKRQWPKDGRGQEYCSVHMGLHNGSCTHCGTEAKERVAA